MTTNYSVQGSLDAASVTSLKEDFEALANNGADVVLDLSKTDFLDSSGVGAIVFLYKRLTAAGRRLELQGVDGQPLRLLEFLRVTSVVPIRQTSAS
ncbi:MAG: STAS domain-containing protein [Elsteraceae bacterium]